MKPIWVASRCFTFVYGVESCSGCFVVLFVLCFMSLLNCYRIGLSCSRLLEVNFNC